MIPESVLALLMIYCIIALSFTFLVYRFVYYRSKQIQNKYFLYKVRDDMIALAVTGKLDENEFLFRELYPIVNDLINRINSFRLKHIVEAVRAQESKVMTDDFVEKLNSELARQPKEVVKVFNNLFLAVFYIIYRNSLMLRILIRLTKISAFLEKCMETPRYAFGILDSQLRAYKYVRFYSSMSHN